MKIFFGLLLSLTTFITLGQKFQVKLDSIVENFITELKVKNVEHIGYMRLTCINYGIVSHTYLFWQRDKQTFIKKFVDSDYDDEHFEEYNQIEIDNDCFFGFYNKYRNDIIAEQVYAFSTKKDSIVGNRIYSQEIQTSHSCYQNFLVLEPTQRLRRFFNYFDLRDYDHEQIDNSKLSKERILELSRESWEVDTAYKSVPVRNINHKHNIMLRIVEWDRVVSKLIDQLESQNRFFKQ